jgi:predicted methyltransferase
MDRTQAKLLRALMKQPLSFWQLVGKQDDAIPGYIDALKTLKTKGYIEAKGDLIAVTRDGKDYARANGVEREELMMCPTCNATGVRPRGWLKDIMPEYEQLAKGRPEVTAEFDQGVVPLEKNLDRIAYIYERGDLENKSIFILGDDDILSIGLALTGKCKRITVVEIDKRVNKFIRKVIREKCWTNVDVYDYDARDPVPDELKGKFDVFVTDPVETVEGMKLFYSRCCEALRAKGCSGYFGVSHFESGLAKWMGVEKDLLRMNLVITDILRDFNNYLLTGERIVEKGFRIVTESPFPVKAPDFAWYRSAFFRVEAVKKPHPLISERVEWARDLYFDEDTFVALP